MSDYSRDGHTFFERVKALAEAIEREAETEGWDEIRGLEAELQATVERETQRPGVIFFPNWKEQEQEQGR